MNLPTVDEMRAALRVVQVTPERQMTPQGMTRMGELMCPSAWFVRALRERRPGIDALQIDLCEVMGAYDYAPSKREGRRQAIRVLREEIDCVAEATP